MRKEMINTALLKNNLLKYIDLRFLLKFVVLFLFLYFFNLSYEALVNPPGLVYSPFLDRYMNYIHLFKLSVLYTAQMLAGTIGIGSHLFPEPYILQVANGSAVQMYYECAGFGLMSFWTAFVFAHDYDIRRKLIWSLAGLILIWMMNCLRFVLLLYILNKDGVLTNGFDHHAVFNWGCYVIIALMSRSFYKAYRSDGNSDCQA